MDPKSGILIYPLYTDVQDGDPQTRIQQVPITKANGEPLRACGVGAQTWRLRDFAIAPGASLTLATAWTLRFLVSLVGSAL